MVGFLVQWLAGLPSWLAVMILAMVPVGELRVALPMALTVYDVPVVPAMLLTIIGNMVPVYFLLIVFERIVSWSRERWQWAAKFWEWLFARTHRKLKDKVEKYGPLALALFVAVPLPVTGAWTGTVAAFVFGLHKGKAFGSILAGVCIAAVVVAIITLGASATVRAIF